MRGILRGTVIALAVALTGGCDDNDYDEHDPPPGQGSIIVDNQTADEINIYVDGNRLAEVNDFDDRALDFKPGVYRVVLDESGGSGNWSGDVDVLEGRRTVVEVTTESFDDDYDVDVFYD